MYKSHILHISIPPRKTMSSVSAVTPRCMTNYFGKKTVIIFAKSYMSYIFMIKWPVGLNKYGIVPHVSKIYLTEVPTPILNWESGHL